jgi:hypothetical protein
MTALETFTTASKQPLTTGRRPDMTALETFTTASKQPLTTGRRPDMTAVFAIEPFQPVQGMSGDPPKAPPPIGVSRKYKTSIC